MDLQIVDQGLNVLTMTGNWLARLTVNSAIHQEVGSSSLPGDVIYFSYFVDKLHQGIPLAIKMAAKFEI